MSTNLDGEYTTNDLISKMVKAKPKMKKSIEQQDTESLNTMDYYKDDSSNKNSLIDELKANNKLLFDPNKKEETIETQSSNNKKDLSIQQDKMNKDINKTINLTKRKNSIYISKAKKILKDFHNICSRCFIDIGNSCFVCHKCKNVFCKNCFKGNYGRNLFDNKKINDNNKEQDLTEKNEKICQYCKNNDNNNNNFMNKILEPLDSMPENEIKILTERKNYNSKINNRNKSEEKIKSLKDQLNESEEFLN